MPKGQGQRHRPGQIVKKLRGGDAMLNASKTVVEAIPFLDATNSDHPLDRSFARDFFTEVEDTDM